MRLRSSHLKHFRGFLYRNYIRRLNTRSSTSTDSIARAKSLQAFISLSSSEEKRLSTGNEADRQKKQLSGKRFAVKDNYCTKSFKTTCASRMLQDFQPAYDATVVKRLEDAGAVLIGKTNMDEFAMGSGSVDSQVGPVKNPWNPLHIAGGSSGGSAVAAACGAVDFALGSDTGGSVRNPASYCGVVGFKPSYGTVSRHGLIPLVNSTDVPSIFSRDVGTAREIFNLISGKDEKDSTTFDDFRSHCPKRKSGKLQIGIPKEYNVPELSSEVRKCWMEAADALEANGSAVKSVSLPHSEYSNACYTVINTCEVASNMARYDGIEFGHRSENAENNTNALYAATRHEGFNEVVRGRILAGNFFLLKRNYQDYFARAAKVRRLITEDFRNVFSNEVDVILCPVTLSDAPSFEEFTKIDNRSQQEVQDLFTVGASLAGMPAISVPISWSRAKLPLSLQLIASSCDDLFLLDVAERLMNLFDFKLLQQS